MVKNIKTKKAVAMIELIFALVIMGIVLMSAPMLIQQSVNSSNVALQQEAIVAAASQTSIILSMHWDENNTNVAAGESPILDVNNVGLGFLPSGLSGWLSGRNIGDGITTLIPSVILGPDFNESNYTKYDDVDDYAGSSFGLMLYNAESTSSAIGEYVDKNINISTTVNYTQDAAVEAPTIGGAVSNVKFITVNLTSNQNIPELEKNITMEAFSCNIGTYAIYGRELP